VGGIDNNNTYNYNGNLSNGTPDSSTRIFTMQQSGDFVFHLSQSVRFYSYATPLATLGPWTHARIESGSYAAGVFTPLATTIDPLTFGQNTQVITPGYYRYSGLFTTSFQRSSGFYDGNHLNFRMYLVPAPGATAMLMTGLAGFAGRHRRAGVRACSNRPPAAPVAETRPPSRW